MTANFIVHACRCSEFIPDVEGLKLDVVVVENVAQSNSDTIDMVKCEIKMISIKQNDIQQQYENSTKEATEALHSPSEYPDPVCDIVLEINNINTDKSLTPTKLLAITRSTLRTTLRQLV